MKRNILKRVNLNKKFDAAKSFPLLFVTAPMGYGKTTSVKNYIAEKKVDAIWVSGIYDEDTRVWNNFCHSLCEINSQLHELIDKTGFPITNFQIKSLISIVKKNISREYILVIDDYHLFSAESPLHHILFGFAVEQIPLLRIICITRSVPAWILAELQSKNLCDVIGTDQLSFDEKEVFDYMDMCNLTMEYGGAVQASKMYEITEGWISAIVLLATGLKLGHELCAFETTYILFERTIFKELDDNEKKMMVKLAILGSFTIEEAIYVFESGDIALMIEQFRQQQQFITFNKFDNLYKVHELFKNFLLEQAKFLNIDINDVKKKIGEWHLSKRNFGISMKYYYESGNILHFFDNIPSHERHFLPYEWDVLCFNIVKSLSLETAIQYPLIYLHFTLLLWATSVAEKEKLAFKIFNIIKHAYVNKKISHELRERILCEIHLTQHVFYFNDPYKVFDMKNCIRKEMISEIITPISSSISFSAWQPSFLFCYYRKPGELDAVVKFIIDNLDCDLLSGVGFGFDKLLISEQYFERGDVHSAKIYAMQAITKANLKDQVHILACAHYILARAAIFDGDEQAVLKQLEIIKFEIPRQLDHLFNQEVRRSYATFVSLCELMIFTTMQSEKLIDIVTCTGKTERQLRDMFICRGFGVYDILRIKIKIMKQEYHDAEVLCDYYESEYARYPTQMGRLILRVYRSIIYYNLGLLYEAHDMLSVALDEASNDNITMVFAENSDFILPMLLNISNKSFISGQFLTHVMTLCKLFSRGLNKIRSKSNDTMLSRREHEVFAMLSRGESVNNISAHLGIAASTVKSHINHIYNKLGVNNRVAAINKMASFNMQNA